MKYRKKPVVVDAEQWDGTYSDLKRIMGLFPYMEIPHMEYHEANNTVGVWYVGTLEGKHRVSPNDYVIKGIKGEFYPCKPDIFEMTYDALEGEKE
jgi:hypothetical protein